MQFTEQYNKYAADLIYSKLVLCVVELSGVPVTKDEYAVSAWLAGLLLKLKTPPLFVFIVSSHLHFCGALVP